MSLDLLLGDGDDGLAVVLGLLVVGLVVAGPSVAVVSCIGAMVGQRSCGSVPAGRWVTPLTGVIEHPASVFGRCSPPLPEGVSESSVTP